MIVSPGPGDFFRLAQIPSSAMKWLKYDVPQEYRYYDSEEEPGHWYIHKKHMLGAIELAYKQTGHVDYSALRDYLQMEIAEAKVNWTVNSQQRTKTIVPSLTLHEAYQTLHLDSNAPDSIVSVVWRHLAYEEHPDRGGDAELFRKYSEAYQQIKKDGK